MKKTIFTLLLAVTAVLALNAETYVGNIVVVRNGQTYNQTVTVTATETDNGMYDFVLQVPMFGTMKMFDVPASTTDGITVYSAVRDVPTNFGDMRTTLFARSIDGMMAANVDIPAYNTTMFFNTVGDHFQLPNGDMEAWNTSINEPNHWHGFMTAYGGFASTSRSLATLAQSTDVHSGSTGTYSAVMKAGQVPVLGIIANGTMTNGHLKAGSMDPGSYENHAHMCNDSTQTDPNGDRYYMPLYAKPDKFNVWLKYTQGTANANNKASVSVKTFDGTYYQEPSGTTYTNLTGSIVGGEIPVGDWTFYSFPFDYDSYEANHARSEAIFVTFSTNGTPAQGSKNDALYVDEMELVYLGAMTDLRYQGATIDGWDPAVTTYNLEVTSVPSLDDFTATIEGVSAVLTKSMEQTGENTYRIAISVVAGDLQEAACYIINATVSTPAGKRGDVNMDGDVDINDVTRLIDVVLGKTVEYDPVAADCNVESGDNSIDINDVTALISRVLTGNWFLLLNNTK